ncbi:hypothetical protein B5F40_09055 [Gordonibacter sp. An230]|nr:hypothetical protein B5F40_09055 [Gordonibacter sp. An230]
MSAVPDARPGAPARARMRRRALAISLVCALAAPLALPAPAVLYFAPLALQRAMGPSAEAAIAQADRGAHGDFTYSLEREYSDAEGRTVYRLVSDSDPALHLELRYGFRWLPWEDIPQGGMKLPFVPPPLENPGPYYEMVKGEEWRGELAEWSQVHELPHQPGARGGASDSEGRG